ASGLVGPGKLVLAGMGGRVAQLPVPPWRFSGLHACEGRLPWVALDTLDPDNDGPSAAAIHLFDLEKREDKTILSGVEAGFAASKDGSKILYKSKETFGIVDAAEGKKVGDGKINASPLMALVDPRLEWRQMFDEAWRLERDFYYDPKMGGLDWKAVGDHYRRLLPYVADRADLNYVL